MEQFCKIEVRKPWKLAKKNCQKFSTFSQISSFANFYLIVKFLCQFWFSGEEFEQQEEISAEKEGNEDE